MKKREERHDGEKQRKRDIKQVGDRGEAPKK